MADFKFNDSVVVLNKFNSFGMAHDSVTVTVTDTMKQGSLLKADGTEAATADAANVVGAIDDLEFLRKLRGGDGAVATGDEVTVAVAKRGVMFNEAVLTYSDGAIDAAGKAALAVFANKFGTIGDDAAFVV
ncbi:putative decoration protein [Vibrio phage 249E41-1]|nr:putative decoration protein [Vibrio phage 249E41-1]CAH9011646.1 putative decoration protein [Vibrio phage 277E43-1]CAH9015744.1 putative decoration protein [Vibrio phage 193E37-1]